MHDYDHTFGAYGIARDLRCRLALALWVLACLAPRALPQEGGTPTYPGPPTATAHRPCFPWPQLPVERCAEALWQQAQRDVAALDARLEVCGAWQRRELLDLKGEAVRLREIYWSLWWVTWPQATREQRDEYTEALIAIVGLPAFLRGELPAPLAVR